MNLFKFSYPEQPTIMNFLKFSQRLAVVSAVVSAVALLGVSSAHADNTWDGGSVGPGDNNWNTAANWGADTLPAFGSAITFTGDTRNITDNNLTADTVIGGIIFSNDGTAGKTNAFTLAGNRITLGGNITTIAGANVTNTISLDMILNNNNRNLDIRQTHALTISGVISEDIAGRQLIKSGTGTLTLTNANTFSGAMTLINSGTINVSSILDVGVASNIGSGNLILFNQSIGATLNYTGAATESNKKISLGGQGIFANLVGKIHSNGSGALVFDNLDFNVVAAVTAVTSRTLVLGGANTDANEIQGRIQNNTGDATGLKVNVTKEGAGLWILSGLNVSGNTYTGLTSVNEGTLLTGRALALPGYNAADRVTVASGATLGVRAGAAGQWTSAELDSLLGATTAAFTAGSNLGVDVLTGDNFTYANNIGATQAAKGLVKSGAGTLTLSHANTHTGNTLVTGGTLALGNALALQHSTFDTASVNGGLNVTGYTTPTLGGLTGSVNLSPTLITGYGSVTNLTLNPQSGTQTYSGVISDGAVGMGLTKSGAGTQVLTSNSNSYTGSTTVSEGTLLLSGSGRLGSGTYAGAISIASGATLEKASGGMQTLSGAITGVGSLVMSSGEMIISNSGNNFGNFTMTSNVGNGRAFFLNPGSANAATVDVVSGTFVFNGGASGTYNNAITVTSSAGPGNVGLAARASTGVVLNNVTLVPGAGFIHLNNDDATTNSLEITNNQTLGGDLVLAVGSFRSNINAVGQVTLSGDIGGSGSLTMQSTGNVSTVDRFGGTGVLNLTGNNGYTGGTILNSGNIALGATGTLGATTGALQVNNTNTGATHRSVQLSLATGADTTTGSLSGTIATAASGTNTANILTQTGRTFTVNQTADGTYAGTISGDGAFTLGGLSTAALTLTGANTYTGATLVSAGRLLVSGSLTSDVTVSDGATLGGGGTVGDLLFGGGSFFDIFEAIDNLDSLTANGISFNAGFGINSLRYNGSMVDWGTIGDGIYTLIGGTLDSTNLDNFGVGNAQSIGGGRHAYFQDGSLQLVVAAIPEPSAALLGGLGVLALLRRRRS